MNRLGGFYGGFEMGREYRERNEENSGKKPTKPYDADERDRKVNETINYKLDKILGNALAPKKNKSYTLKKKDKVLEAELDRQSVCAFLTECDNHWERVVGWMDRDCGT